MNAVLQKMFLGVLASFLLTLSAEAQPPQNAPTVKNKGKVYAQWNAVRQAPTTTGPVVSASRKASAGGEQTDEHGIIIAPAEGESKLYERTGQGMAGEDYGDGMFLYYEEQDGTIEVVECADGTVYFKDLISHYQRGYWVKGTKNGSTITLPANQPLAYYEDYNASVVLHWAYAPGDGTVAIDNTKGDSFTFTVGDDGSLTLEGTSGFMQGVENYFMGTFWSDNNEFTAFGDALTVYRPINIVTQVDALPYINNFTTMGDQKSFTVVDANNDNSTWIAFDGKYSLFASYDNDGDDWLISPAIRLEAGKNYRVAFDTWKNLEDAFKTIELKMGKAASPEAMTTQVIPATEVEGMMAQTVENERLRVDETGYYYFGIHDISEAGSYSVYADNFVIEESAADAAPAAIADLQVVQDADALKATVSFTAPAKAFNGSALEGNLTKIEVLRDGVVVKTLEDVAPGTAQQFIDEGLTIGRHTYEALAYNEYGFGQKSAKLVVFFFEAQEIPYTLDFTDPSTLGVLNIIDANGDGNTWAWSDYGNTVTYGASYNADGDDYLVVMPVKAVKGHNYKVTFTAHTEYSAERFEVLAGREGTPEALTLTVIPSTPFQADLPTAFEGSFTAEADGLYFVAVHAISDMYNYNLYADALTIEKGAEPTAPAAISNLTVTAGEKGAKLANISFIAPAKAINGSDLAENLTKVELLCDGQVVVTQENVTSGATVEMTATVEKPGYYTYQVLTYNASGAGVPSDKVKEWIGQGLPGDFYNVEAADNGTSVVFSWNRITEGQDGHYLNPDEVEYQILNTEFNGWSYDITDMAGSVTGADHYTLDFNTDEGEQQMKFWAIKPVNEAGEGTALIVSLLVGAPYTLPFEESVANGNLASQWTIDNSAALYIVGDASDNDGYGLALTTTWFTGEFALTSGKLSLQDATKPTLYVDVKANGITTLKVKGGKLNEETALIEEVAVGSEWTTVKVPLDAIKDARFSRLAFAADFVNPSTENWMTGGIDTWGDAVFFDNIRVIDDITDGISAMPTTNEGRTANVFDLQGRRVANGQSLQLKKGLYIVNGKKTVY